MSEEHHHEHGEECHCHDCEEKRNNGEKTSMEEAGGVAVGFVGHVHGYNADVEARFADAMIRTGKYVEKEAGTLLGHIKIAIYHEDGTGVTLNLTDLDNGVEHHGMMEPCEKVNFNFMAAVLDVDKHELEHHMMHFLEDTGIDYHLEEGHHHHHHDGDECCCGEHHHHDHDHEDHDHHHDDECCCGEHHHHDHDDHDDGECHCKACEQRRKEEEEEAQKPKKSFLSKFRRKTE